MQTRQIPRAYVRAESLFFFAPSDTCCLSVDGPISGKYSSDYGSSDDYCLHDLDCTTGPHAYANTPAVAHLHMDATTVRHPGVYRYAAADRYTGSQCHS